MNEPKKLYKNKSAGKLEGVCAGFAEYFNADVTLIRLLWAIMALVSFGLGVLGYIVCAIIMPDKSQIFNDFNWNNDFNGNNDNNRDNF